MKAHCRSAAKKRKTRNRTIVIAIPTLKTKKVVSIDSKRARGGLGSVERIAKTPEDRINDVLGRIKETKTNVVNSENVICKITRSASKRTSEGTSQTGWS